MSLTKPVTEQSNPPTAFELDLHEVGPLKNSWEGARERLATTQMYLLIGCGWKGEMQGWTPPSNFRVYQPIIGPEMRWMGKEIAYLPVKRYSQEEACRYAAEAIEIQQEEARVARLARLVKQAADSEKSP